MAYILELIIVFLLIICLVSTINCTHIYRYLSSVFAFILIISLITSFHINSHEISPDKYHLIKKMKNDLLRQSSQKEYQMKLNYLNSDKIITGYEFRELKILFDELRRIEDKSKIS
ncbi:hypothetical protein A7M79_00510 [Acinetobacter baumannii]|uniref:hypothetical protein n=1 Tax=Acinetobacter baumannii TaxID=470 RepID=UPI0008DD05C6|nr:hypothetical protein [Acinetobacter baumannii]OIH12006.1 hypothetical protein A7M79_00510 [Acinetobacter baumannii]